MSIPLVNLKRMHQTLGAELQTALQDAVTTGDFILGSQVTRFEEEFAAYCGVKHCIGVGSGLEALALALRGFGIGPGDEVITSANTFIATALAIHHTGATPVLVDHDPRTFNLDAAGVRAAITPRTRAIIPVHLYGQPADMDPIISLALQHRLVIIEDAAQAHGARYQGRRCGSLGRAGCFSFYPGKNLGAIGDGGAITTDDGDLAHWLRAARNYGSHVKHQHPIVGWNSRLDNVQAAVLRVKLRHLDAWNERRRQLAARYGELLADSGLTTPTAAPGVEHVYHLFVIGVAERDSLLHHLTEKGIGAGLHYPIPIHQQDALRNRCRVPRSLKTTEDYCGRILSLPMCPFLSTAEQDRVVAEIRAWQIGRQAERVRGAEIPQATPSPQA